MVKNNPPRPPLDDRAVRFWERWWEADELGQLDLLAELPIVGSGLFKTTATQLNSYLIDLRHYIVWRQNGAKADE